MELEIIMLSKISHIQKDKYYTFSLLCIIQTWKKDMDVKEGVVLVEPVEG
jgi:hypothetical protein